MDVPDSLRERIERAFEVGRKDGQNDGHCEAVSEAYDVGAEFGSQEGLERGRYEIKRVMDTHTLVKAEDYKS
jgi:hypothetical protein